MPLALVIEDDAVQRLAARLVLQGEGFHVEEADDGDQGLAKARAFRPDIVLCDLLMPGLDGWQLIAELRQDPQLWDVPVIVLTAMTERAQVRRAMNSGADDFLLKPVQAEELCEAVEALLARRDALRAHYTQMLRRRLGETLEQEKQQLALRYEQRLAEELGRGQDAQGVQVWRNAVVLSLGIGPDALLAALGSREGAQALCDGTSRLRDLLLLFGATRVLGADSGLVAVFADPLGPRVALRHAARAMKSVEPALERALDLATGVETGGVLVLPLPDPAEGQAGLQVAAGPAAAAAALLRQRARQLHWRVAASPGLRALNAGCLRAGRLELAGPGPAAVEVEAWLEPGGA
ncbi:MULTISPECIES: response regulator [Ramlibacter]|uniref:Response regulator n=1 Tax=Ramlibacter aquaticus TaxID=2780094 RepID=A0ABR9SK71_9BURK|nr:MULTISPECIES: response regulator [Ramlibacter]MBE7942304.1 response regulator [Ramlibacter aquaticus]